MRVIDSHTAGEPTRVIMDGGPDLGSGSVAERARVLQDEYHEFCSSVLCEPRGNDALVGALLVEPSEVGCTTGVIFFNTVQNLGMCGHASIGLAVTLAYLGLIKPGTHRFDTPVGVIAIDLKDKHLVSVTNVESYRLQKDVRVSVKGYGEIVGDVAWGGNWFFLVKESPVEIIRENIRQLTDLGLDIRRKLETEGVTGTDGAWIDHIELYGPPVADQSNSRCFVLVPSGSYDRSPCGTGCSAKMACLASDGNWREGDHWIQESIIGSTYSLSYQARKDGSVDVTIEGRAYVTAEAQLHFDPSDPYRSGISV